MDFMHEYEKVIVIRTKYRVDGDGRRTAWLRMDSDILDHDAVLGLLVRAQNLLMGGGYFEHDGIDAEKLAELVGDFVVVEDEE